MAPHGSKETSRPDYKAAVLTVSDSTSRGEREDLSGPRCRELLSGLGFDCVAGGVVPDEIPAIAARLREWCDSGLVHLVITTGGTGLSPRDVTPEATRQVIEREAPGFGELLRLEGFRKNPRAMLSRGTAGLRNRTLIVNLPGSVRGVEEGLQALAPILAHALEIAQGEAGRCGS
jgi:molybdenum cofactor synthesis domain-containing protein